jgi:putative transposase
LRKQYRETQDKEVGRILYSERGLRNLIPDLKRQHPFLKAVYSSVLKNAALRLSKAIRDYQDGKHGRRAKQVNWPKFRAWKRAWFSLQYDEPWKGYALSGRTLTLVLGQDAAGKQLSVKLPLAEGLPHWVNREHVRQCRIVSEIYNPYFLKSLDKRIDHLKAKRHKCKKKARLITRDDGSQFWLPSRRWLLLNARLQDVYRKRREQTKQFRAPSNGELDTFLEKKGGRKKPNCYGNRCNNCPPLTPVTLTFGVSDTSDTLTTSS